jgi:hypothetical protein
LIAAQNSTYGLNSVTGVIAQGQSKVSLNFALRPKGHGDGAEPMSDFEGEADLARTGATPGGEGKRQHTGEVLLNPNYSRRV